jgi:hypothetical protein
VIDEVHDTWLFDVDGCIIDSMSGRWLRPFAREALEAVKLSGYRVVLWSAGGADHAIEVAARLNLHDVIDDCFDKAIRGPDRRWLVDHLHSFYRPTVCVDDRPEEVPAHLEVISVFPYITHEPRDKALLAVMEHLSTVGAAHGNDHTSPGRQS